MKLALPTLGNPLHLGAVLGALVLSWPTQVAADCVDGVRKPKASETEFHSRAVAALAATLPPLPIGVEIVEGKPFDFKAIPEIGEVLCAETKDGAFSPTIRRKYFRKHSEAERRHLQADYDALTAQFQALKKTPPDRAAEQQLLRQKSNSAWQAARDAEKANDKAAAQARDAEYRVFRNQADDIDTQHVASVKAQLDDLDQRRTRIDLMGQKVEVVLGMNLQRLPNTSGPNPAGAYGVASPGKSVGLRVHNAAFVVGGTEGPLRQALVAAIDRARLQSLVGKALPTMAESEGFAAKAAPPIVADIVANTPPVAAAAPVTPEVAAPTTASRANPPAPATTPPTVAAAPAAPASTGKGAADAAKQAVDTVNKLRGLFGR